MSTPVQIVPTLTILEDEGEFTVRVGGQGNAQAIATAVVPLLATLGARKLLLITPMDTKVFKFDTLAKTPDMAKAEAVAVSTRRKVIADAGAPPSADDADAEYERYQSEEREAERIAKEQASTAQADPELGQEEETTQSTTRTKSTRAKVLPTQNPCGRCGGGGALEGGASCPVCKGTGRIAQWGRKAR